jgi:hypothetical protein
MIGFIGIENYDTEKIHYFGLMEKKKGKYVSESKAKVMKGNLEYAIFFVPYYGVKDGIILQESPENWVQDITYPKFLEKQNGLATICLWVDVTHGGWYQKGPNIKNDGIYRVCYNDGDDSYYHALFATKEEALECFNFIIELNFGYVEFYEILQMFGFWPYA